MAKVPPCESWWCRVNYLQTEMVRRLHGAGFNRTGFIMCSYLCEAEGMTVDEALDSFAAVRSPGVKHGGHAATHATACACITPCTLRFCSSCLCLFALPSPSYPPSYPERWAARELLSSVV